MRTCRSHPAIQALLAVLAAVAIAAAPGHSTEAPGNAAHAPVLLELFTSQGCSSCPPADRLLSRLGRDSNVSGEVIPLAFHVDYWNRLGWRDPFSSPAWSARQRDYAVRIPGESVYTPQLVVNGHTACVGSDERSARRLIQQAIAGPSHASLQPRAARTTGAGIDLDIRVDLDSTVVAGQPALYAVLFSNDRTTHVTRGENANRTLHDDFVVRRLTRLATIPEPGSHEVSGHLDWPPDTARDSLGAAVFLQDVSTGHVLAAQRVPLGKD